MQKTASKFSLLIMLIAFLAVGLLTAPNNSHVYAVFQLFSNTQLFRNVQVFPPPPCGTGVTQITDVRGAESITYPVVNIGTQCWMKENLRTTKKPDGTDISALAYCNPAGCGSPWGRLYNWATALNVNQACNSSTGCGATGTGAKIQGICPTGWHIPSDYNADASDDWQKLINYAGGDAVAGEALKEAGTTNWQDPNCGQWYVDPAPYCGDSRCGYQDYCEDCDGGCCSNWYDSSVCIGGATNSSSFTALPAGYYWSGFFTFRGSGAYFWSSSENGGASAGYRKLDYYGPNVSRDYTNKLVDAAVRCVKD